MVRFEMKSKSTNKPDLSQDESNAQVQLLFQNNPLPMWIYDQETLIFLDVNEAAVDHYGYARDEFLKMRLTDIYPKEDVPLVAKPAKGKRARLPQSGECRHVKKDGSIIHVEITSRKLDFQNTRAVITTANDITKNKIIQQALAESEERFRNLYENSAIGIYRTAPDGRILLSNPALVRMLGYDSFEELATRNLEDRNHAGYDRKQFRKMLERDGEIRGLESVWKRRDGSPIFVRENAHLARDEKGKVLYYEGTIEDISDKQHAEDALRASEAELNAILASMPDVVMVIDKDGRYLKIAPTNSELLHLPPEDLLGHKIHDVFSRQKADELVGYIRASLQKKEIVRFEYAILIGSHIKWFAGTTSPLTEDTVVWVGRDITERKHAEERLLASQELLKDAQRIGHIGSWILDIENDVLTWSDEIYRMFEIDPETSEASYEAFLETVHPDDRDMVDQAYTNAVKNRVPYSITHRLLFPDGRIKYIKQSCETFYDAVGKPIRSVGTAQDITDRQQVEEALQQRVRELSVIYDAARRLQQILTPESLAEELINLLKEIFNYEHCVVLLDDERGNLIPFAVSDQERWFKSIEEYKEKISGWNFKTGEGIIGWVIQHKQSVRLDNARLDPRYKNLNDEVNSELCVPLRVGERIIGAINVESIRLNAFTESDQRLLETLAAQTAIAIQNARLFEAEQLRRQDAETLRQAAAALSSSLDTNQIVDKLMDELSRVISFDSSTVFIDEKKGLRALSGRGLTHPEKIINHIFPNDGENTRLIKETRRPLIIADITKDPHFVLWDTGQLVRSWMGVPLIARGNVIGIITFDGVLPNLYKDHDAEMALAIASHAAAAIENARLYQDAVRAAERSRVLHTVSQEIARISQDAEQVYTSIHQAALQLLPGEVFVVSLLNEEQKQVDAVYLFDRDGQHLPQSFPLNQGLSSRIILSGQSLLINDDLENQVEAIHFGSPDMVRSIVAVPMRVGGKVIGMISVQSYQPDVYNHEDQLLLELLAAQAAIAIQNARLFTDAKNRIKELEALNQASRALTGTLDLNLLLENILRSAKNAIPGAEKGVILLKDKDGEHLHITMQIGYEDERIMHLPFHADRGYSGKSFSEKRPLLIDDASVFSLPFDEQVDESSEVKSGIVVPLLVKGEAIGVIALDNATQKSAFTQNDLDLLTIFASSAASVIHNARLFEETHRRAEEFEALYKTAAEASTQSDLQTLLDTIIERARALSNTSGSALYLFDPERGDLELVAIRDLYLHTGIRIQLGEGLSGHVAQTKQPLVVEDYRKWENRARVYEGLPYKSVLGIPMLYSGELIGVMTVHHLVETDEKQPSKKFSEQDINLLSLFASTAAGIVYSARLLEQTRRRLNELSSLSEISSTLRSAKTRAEMTSVILEKLMSALKADGCSFVVQVPGRTELFIEDTRGCDEPYRGMWIPADEGLSSIVFATGKPYITSDVRDEPKLFRPDLNGNARTSVLVPLKSQDKTIGIVTLSRAEKNGVMPPPFSESDMRLLTSITDMAANALQRHSLHEETTRYAEQLFIINNLGRDLSESLDLPHIYEKLSRSALDLLPDSSSVFISLLEFPQQNIKTVYGIHNGNILDPEIFPSLPFDGSSHTNQGYVIYNGKPLIVPDANENVAQKKALLFKLRSDDELTQSALYVPMKAEGRVIGVLNVQSYLKDRYSQADAGLLELVANTAAVAVQNARLFTQLKRRIDQLSALHSVDTTISSTTDLRVSLQSVLENVTRELKINAADVLIINPATLTLQYTAGIGFLTSEIRRISLPLGKGQAGLAALERHMIRVSNLSEKNIGSMYENLIASERFVSYAAIPLMAKGEVKGVLEIFHRSALDLDDDLMSFLEMLANQAALAIDNAMLFEGMEKVNIELSMAYDATIQGWSQALELRDQETQGHSMRVLDLTLRLAAEMGITGQALQDIRRGVLLHDIGKMGIPDSILHKPGPLDDEERKMMRMHPQYAYNMLFPISYLRNALDIPYCHHEKWDGSGYPRGLSGETIPLAARIFSIVDVYDALTSNRPYRDAWSKEKTLEYIREQTGKYFDPHIVEIFFRIVQD
jgi:PAS domain S-box-containing protein